MSGLLYYRSVFKTGRAIGKALGVPSGRDPSRLANRGYQRGALIRWGSQQACVAAQELNTPQALAAASDKLRTFQVLGEAGIRTPEFTANGRELSWNPGLCWLGRQRHGHRGRDIIVYDGVDYGGLWEPGDNVEFFTKYVPNRFEARIHVFDGEVIRVQKKYLDFPDQRTSEYIKNHANGYRFRAPRDRLHSSRLEAAVGAVEALGLDFGAVDLLVGEDNLEYVLEVNTAPACSPLTAKAYVDRFAEWLDVTPNYSELEVLRVD